jgi:hypothetical protein
MSHRRFLTILLSLACGLAFYCLTYSTSAQQRRVAAAEGQQETGRQDGRLRPPAGLKCPINNTTSFTGRVLAYSRQPGSIFIRVRTDEETTEQFTLRHGKGVDPTQLFLLKGEAFKQSDWKQIETRRSKLKPNMRVTVWACYEGDQPKAELIEWRPGERRSGSVY